MNAMSDALKKRRMSSLPKDPMGVPATAMPESQPMKAEGGGVESLLKALSPEDKQKLYALLDAEMEGAEDSDDDTEMPEVGKMEDSAGQLKSTPGEKEAIAKEDMMKGAEALADGRFEGDERPRNLSERVKINIAKMMKKKG